MPESSLKLIQTKMDKNYPSVSFISVCKWAALCHLLRLRLPTSCGSGAACFKPLFICLNIPVPARVVLLLLKLPPVPGNQQSFLLLLLWLLLSLLLLLLCCILLLRYSTRTTVVCWGPWLLMTQIQRQAWLQVVDVAVEHILRSKWPYSWW